MVIYICYLCNWHFMDNFLWSKHKHRFKKWINFLHFPYKKIPPLRSCFHWSGKKKKKKSYAGNNIVTYDCDNVLKCSNINSVKAENNLIFDCSHFLSPPLVQSFKSILPFFRQSRCHATITKVLQTCTFIIMGL